MIDYLPEVLHEINVEAQSLEEDVSDIDVLIRKLDELKDYLKSGGSDCYPTAIHVAAALARFAELEFDGYYYEQ